MRTWAKCAAALAFGIVTAPFSDPAGAGDSGNWMRDYVQQRQLQVLQRLLGNRSDEAVITPQIIGGNPAPANKWPFQVALLTASVADNYSAQYCGGSLIGTQHVLTAAHCVDFVSGPAAIRVLTGTQSLASGGTRQKVESITIHPKWKHNTQDYDVAVIKLKSAVAGITPVKLLSSAQETDLSAPGTVAYVTGWGDIKPGAGIEYPAVLYAVQVPIASTNICNAAKSYGGAVTARMICAGLQQGGKDSCQGDSGGPLTVRDSGGKWRIQAGIVSWGEGCALKNFYGVYSRLAVLSSWVRSIVNSASAVARSEPCRLQGESAPESCLDQAIASVAAETKDYLDQLKRDGSRAQAFAAEAAQQAWSRSLDGLCAFDTATSGATGRKACVLREMRNRADTLAEHLSKTGN